MSPTELAILGLYFLTLVILAVFGLHRYIMVYLYFRHQDRRALPAAAARAAAARHRPAPALQRDVRRGPAARLRARRSATRASCSRSRCSTTPPTRPSTIAQAAVERYREQGFDIHYIHRDDRTGYKAGALEAGLKVAKGEFVLIFDADFVAPPDILEKTLGHFADPQVGMVQVRWGHVNRDYSLLTQVQSILLDGHFILEHGGRNRAGRFFNFNGTAGIWRREAIDDAGGWQHDTLTEDLDLSLPRADEGLALRLPAGRGLARPRSRWR